ncbi:helix-turn-helix transcriptional regulator [Duffyella gerundensis]|uniref:helix-turn-helix transcriptional regulator n=1 Tax=Duffyella gerundensis TaxID=1619313 RepID=UPI0016549DC1|nr:LuxR C-terminal-related transcriptional regulator [Duffyella gerundensis]
MAGVSAERCCAGALSAAIIDSSSMTLHGIATLLQNLPVPVNVVWQERQTAIMAVRLQQQPVDLLISERSGVGESDKQGIAMLLNLAAQLPALRIGLFSDKLSQLQLCQLHGMTQFSLLSRKASLIVVREQLIAIAQGERVISPGIATKLPINARALRYLWGQLTAREKTVLRALIAGESIKAIAEAQQMSIKTVSSHKYNGLRKLYIDSKFERARFISEGIDLDHN